MSIFQNITNTEIANLSNCESEPIHIPGTIQPHGVLLAVDNHLVIQYCSSNTEPFFNKNIADLLGSTLEVVCGADAFMKFKVYVSEGQFDDVSPFVFNINGIMFNASVHFSGALLLIEFEPFPDGQLPLGLLYHQTRRFATNIEKAENLQYLLEDTTAEIRRLTGYDRVMIYRFDEEYNGAVCAESKEDYLESFLGLHYPHTDIPPQARQLYLKNLLRVIVDVQYTAVPIFTLNHNSANNNAVDLSHSVLRSVSPLHIEYLKNMGVTATLTVSLIKEGRLWGLVACHHNNGSKFIPHHTRIAVLLQGHFLASQIRVQEVAEEHREKLKVEWLLQQLVDKIDQLDAVEKHFGIISQMIKVMNATGAALVVNDKVYVNGITPSVAAIRKIALWIKKAGKDKVYATNHLAKEYSETNFIDEAAGLLSIALGKKGESYVMWFRPELATVVNWAGKPDKAVIIDPETEKLSPRKSFALWQQVIRQQSAKWTRTEVSAAIRIASALQSHLYTEYLEEQEMRYRVLSEQLKKANDELANINWITAHDLKEPLRKINVFTSRIMDADALSLSNETKFALTRIKGATDRMKHLLDDILAYTMLENKEQVFVKESLETVVAQVRDEVAEELEEWNIRFEMQELPQLNMVPFQMRLLFKNLISNAIKFTDISKADHFIRISCELMDDPAAILPNGVTTDGSFYKIAVTDNGVGFNNEFVSRIFEVFYRAHDNEKYAGTGIGLAICKKIATLHNGFITAYGEEGEGASFALYLPAILY